jgi:diacylglycerol kinase (ATP)
MEQTSTLSSSSQTRSSGEHLSDYSKRSLDWRLSAIVTSFGHAFSGIWYLFSQQRNAQIHAIIGICVLVSGAVVGLERWEWLALILTIALVLTAEGINTAVEYAVDVATPAYHPLARIAKDVAAGAVLLCAMAAVLVGCILFLPHLWPVVVWGFTRI